MKKYLSIVLVLLLMVFVTCADNGAQSGNTTGNENVELLSEIDISVNNLAELEKMREMISCSDEAELSKYLSSVDGGTVLSREDIEDFVKLIDSMPYVPLIDGEISWIYHSSGQSVDTNAPYNVVYISTKAANGDWFRIEYILSADVSKKLAEETGKLTSTSLVTTPIQSRDKRMTVHAETREAHPSGTGDLIRYYAEIDGIFAYVVYYTGNANSVNTTNLIQSINISGVKNNSAIQ